MSFLAILLFAPLSLTANAAVHGNGSYSRSREAYDCAKNLSERSDLETLLEEGAEGEFNFILRTSEGRAELESLSNPLMTLIRGFSAGDPAVERARRMRMLSVLIQRVPAVIDAQDEGQMTPLHWATLLKFSEAVGLLIEKGANLGAVTAKNRTVLDLLMGLEDVPGLQALWKHVQLPYQAPTALDSLPNTQLGASGVPVMIYATRFWDRSTSPHHSQLIVDGHPHLRALLESREAGQLDLDASDADGDTALHHAVRLGDVEAVRLLLKAGANAQLRNKLQSTPQRLAKELLLQKRAELGFVNLSTLRAQMIVEQFKGAH